MTSFNGWSIAWIREATNFVRGRSGPRGTHSLVQHHEALHVGRGTFSVSDARTPPRPVGVGVSACRRAGWSTLDWSTARCARWIDSVVLGIGRAGCGGRRAPVGRCLVVAGIDPLVSASGANQGFSVGVLSHSGCHWKQRSTATARWRVRFCQFGCVPFRLRRSVEIDNPHYLPTSGCETLATARY